MKILVVDKGLGFSKSRDLIPLRKKKEKKMRKNLNFLEKMSKNLVILLFY